MARPVSWTLDWLILIRNVLAFPCSFAKLMNFWLRLKPHRTQTVFDQDQIDFI